MSFLTKSSTDGGGASRSNGNNRVNSSAGSTTLAKMIAAAASQKRGVKWSHVLHYLKAHCIIRELDDDDADDSSADYRQRHEEILRLESPLQAHYVANADLALELAPTSDGHSVLRAALPVAPLSILRVLVHLGPAAVRHVDVVSGRLVLQTACRFPPTPALDAALALLIVAHPPALVHRCHQGKTPLHYFLCHHAKMRSPETTALFCRNLQAYKEHFYTLRQPTNRTGISHQRGHETMAIPSGQVDPSSADTRICLPDIPKPGCSVPPSSSSTGQGGVTKIPYNAAIIPDAVYGCLPLHYAALYGASPATVKVVYHAYPTAKHAVDSHGRTPLHWHLGAGTLDPENPVTMEGESLAIESSSDTNELASTLLTPEDPASPYYNRHLDPSIVQLLLSSRVVRTTDFQNRNPLHWAVTYIASHSYLSCSLTNCAADNDESTWSLLSIVQLLLDSYASQCLAQDQWGMTPLTLLFHTVHKIQKRLYFTKCQPLGRKLTHGFGPPLALIQKLLMVPSKHHGIASADASTTTGTTNTGVIPPTGVANQPNTIAAKEDKAGRLPIHVALQIAASTEIVQFLIQLYPASLVHTTSTHETAPLHSAFDCEWTAPLQSVDTIAALLFQSYQAGKYGSTVDGRLAMKLEDATGYYPIHYACHHGAAVSVMELLVDRYPACALLEKPNGDLPIQCVIQSSDSGKRLLSAALAAAVPAVLTDGSQQHEEEKYDESGNAELLAETRAKLQCLIRPLLSDPGKLLVADSVAGMLPLHIAVLFEAASYAVLLRMLELAPISATRFTGEVKSHNLLDTTGNPSINPKRVGTIYSALDLHDVCKVRTPICSIDEWQRMRELLFSFSPILESHRHRQELLDRCVRVVIDEINGSSLGDEDANVPYHLAACREKDGNPPDLELTHTVSAMEAKVCPRTGRRRRRTVSKRLAPNKSRYSREAATRRFFGPNSPENANTPETLNRQNNLKLQITSSIYDDDDVHLQYDAPPMMGSENDEEFDDDGRSASSCASDDGYGDDTGTEGCGTRGDDTGSRGSQSFYTGTASGSRQQTTFEDGSGEETSSDDDSQTFNDESTTRSTYRRESEVSQRRSRRGRRNRRSLDDDSKDLSRRVTFEDESTMDRNSFDDDSISQSAGSIFENAKQRLVDEEKKDDGELVNDSMLKPLKTPRAANITMKEATNVRPSFMSEVGMRLWTFFIMFCDPRNPNDHYVNQLADIIGEINVVDFDLLISGPVPSYVTNCTEKGEINKDKSFRDAASPKCRELIHRTSYFLGKYDFNSEDDALVYRSQVNESVVVAANEWQFVTEVATNAKMLGMSEQNIWATGEALAEVGLTFQSYQKPVWIMFTKDASVYENEIGARSKLGVSVDDSNSPTKTDGFVPILQHFNAASAERQLDRTYSVHSKDSRFNAISLRSTTTSEKKLQILLHEYPFAIVYPAPSHGTLLDFLLRYGVDSLDDARQILTQIALALNSMHKHYICCGNLSLRNIVSNTSIDTPDITPRWELLHLSNAVHVAENSSYLGGIDFQGRAQFDMVNFPPEMFASLSSDALKRYLKYWQYVESHFKVSIDKALITPFVDLATGATYVVKCHFIPLTTRPETVSLPYDLVECNSGIDVWALGQLLFSLLTGRTMFHTSIRDGRFLNFGEIYHWKADLFLYEHVHDFLALDVLRQMLSDEASRKNLSIDYILLHPFFLNESDRGSSAHKLIEEVRFQVAAQKRSLDAKLVASTEKSWLEKRSLTIHCWDFDVLRRFYISPTEIVRGMTSRKMNISIPCGIIMLPYNNPISYNAAFNGTSVHAERLGNALLQLSKACFYASSIQEAIFKDGGASACRWSLSEMIFLINLPSDDFHSVQADMAYLSARHIESFRKDPMIVARKLVQERIERVVSCFEDRDLFMYFVDEWSCRVVRSVSSPIPVTDHWRGPMIESGLLFMCICLLYARGVSRGLDAFATLIFQADDTTIPQSWVDSARGLTHKLDDNAFQSEVMMLQDGFRDVFGSLNGVCEALAVLKSFLSECDPMNNVGGMTRVVASEACIWTTTESADQISYEAQHLTFRDALCKQKKSPTEHTF